MYQVNDPQVLLSQVDELEQIYQNLSRARERMVDNHDNIVKVWQSTGEDRTQYLAQLNDAIRDLGQMITGLVRTGASLDTYARDMIAHANDN